MGKIKLIEVTKDNLNEICKLSNTLNETPIGFVKVDLTIFTSSRVL
ncbi:MAG: hypothetical protein IBX70_13285 [Clostridia bacterium]|nr:hypothetical protein [Clostridia bacterium]